jgi:hypothetical protein
VVQDVAPIITLLGDVTVHIEVGDTYEDAGASALDNTDGNITDEINTTGLPIDTDINGTYVISYNVSDKAGNKAQEMNRTVVVKAAVLDTELPRIELNGSVTVSLLVGDTYEELGAKASDNIDGNITENIVINHTVDTLKEGSYTVTYNVSDEAGNEATEVNRTVNVTAKPEADTTPPVITLDKNTTENLTVGTAYIAAIASVTDNNLSDTNIAVIISGDEVNTSKVGTYTVTYDAHDSAGNQAIQVTRTIIVTAKAVVDTDGDGIPDEEDDDDDNNGIKDIYEKGWFSYGNKTLTIGASVLKIEGLVVSTVVTKNRFTLKHLESKAYITANKLGQVVTGFNGNNDSTLVTGTFFNAGIHSVMKKENGKVTIETSLTLAKDEQIIIGGK